MAALLAVALLATIVFGVKRNAELPASPSRPLAASSAVSATNAAPDPSDKPAASTPSVEADACKAAERLAAHNLQGAIASFSTCKGRGRGSALAAIGMAAQSAVSAKKCGAKDIANQAAALGAGAAKASLPSNCRN